MNHNISIKEIPLGVTVKDLLYYLRPYLVFCILYTKSLPIGTGLADVRRK